MVVIAFFRVVFFLIFVLSYFAVAFIVKALFFPFEKTQTRILCWFLHYYCVIATRLFCVEIKSEWHGLTPHKDENFLLALNHLSYLDVVILASVFPTRFVTSVEVKKTPFLGWLAELGASVYVERRDRANIQNEVNEITEVLNDGQNVAFCPEATSTNGDELKPFKKSLFVAATQSGKRVLPVCLNYRMVNGEPLRRNNRDRVFWYGDMTFLPHFLQLLFVKSIEVKVDFLEVISEPEDHRRLAELTQQRIKNCFVPVSS